MYLPAAFRQDDRDELHRQMRATPFALLTSVGADGVLASHLPLLLEPDEGEFGDQIERHSINAAIRFRFSGGSMRLRSRSCRKLSASEACS